MMRTVARDMINIDTSHIDESAMGISKEYSAEVLLKYSMNYPEVRKNAEPDLRATQNTFFYKPESQGQLKSWEMRDCER